MNLPLFMEGTHIVPMLARAACNGSNTSDRVSLENYGRLAVLIIVEQGGADASAITVDMITAATSGTESTGITVSDWWALEDVTVATTADTWAKQTAGTTLATSAASSGVSYYILDIAAEDLSSAGTSYPFIEVNLTSGSASNYATMIGFLYQPRYAEDLTPSGQS